ncbi:hypothetical protein Pcinc_041537 [Petrolisthes cinctipes]|uniref:FAS1 domain-containing protein n=1 Tax=Petrolisthes cinctipes TaxID=88211 RepID=A0AAE1BLV2_PETCI|nr:hypothetical protein Pcinc_041537 [Petrolisthes cinctipes]
MTPNVCVDREEIDEGKEAKDMDKDTEGVAMTGNTFLFTFGNMEMTSCSETRDKYTCISRNSRRGLHKTVIVTHRCCHGYTREASGCTRVEMRSMADTLQEIGATDFLTLAKATGLVDRLDRNLTIFVPTNEALQDFNAALDIENELDVDMDRGLNEVFYEHRRRREASKQDMVMAHMAPGIHYASDLKDEQVLKSVMEDSTLRINTYATSPPTATVNCARLAQVDQHTTHGVVHTISTVLHPVTSSLAQLITADPQFSILAKLMEQANLIGQLGDDGQLTLFAPTDAAFNSLPASTLEALLENNACLDAVMKNHLLPNVICSAAVQGKARTVNLLDSYLLLERTEDDELLVGGEEGTKVLARDIVATNGVMHVIDSPILPLEAQPVLEVLQSRNLTQFLSLLETAGMLDELAGLTDVTVFAPSNKAIDDLPEDVKERLLTDPVKLRDILNYHVAAPSLQASDIENNHIAKTRTEHPLRINLYSRSPLLAGLGGGRGVRVTAGCSRVSVLDQRACGAVVHIVERLLALPKESVMNHIQDNDRFSIFTKMLKDTGMDETLRGEGPFTVLAPSDHVFRTLPEAELNHVLENVELQRDLVQQHVLQEHVCCAGINPNTWLFMDYKRPLSGSTLHLRRSSFGHIMAGRARITHCSAPSHNGLVHTVNQLLVDVHPNARSQDQQGIFSPNFSAAHFLNG